MQPISSIYTQLTTIFHVGFDWIHKGNTPDSRWITNRQYPLSTGEFLRRYADPLTILGVSFDNTTRYGMFDIDRHSKYHPRNNLIAFDRIFTTVAKIGLVEFISIESSDSGGIHLYFPFPKKLRTFYVASLLRVTLINAGFTIANGQLEIFPNTKRFSETEHTYYKAHRLPLQPDSGSRLLDENFQPRQNADNLSHEQMLRAFVREFEWAAQRQDIALFESKLNWGYRKFTDDIAKYQYKGKLSETARDWKENLELTFAIGWTDYGQTNKLLPQFVAYGIVFLGIEDNTELHQWVKEQVAATNGYLTYCQHHQDIDRRIEDWINASTKNGYYLKYCQFPQRCGISPYRLIKTIQPAPKQCVNPHNIQQKLNCKERMAAVMTAIIQLPRKLVERKQAIQAKSLELFGQKFSTKVLYKSEYKDIWQAETTSFGQTQTGSAIVPPTLEKNDTTENAKTQTESAIVPSHCTYEVLLAEAAAPVASISELGFEDLDLAPEHIELQSESESNLTDSTTGNESETKSIVSSTYIPNSPAAAIQPIKNAYRSPLELAVLIRSVGCGNLSDDLLTEFLAHPDCESIDVILTTIDGLLSATRWDEIAALTANLDDSLKQSIWQCLTTTERSQIKSLQPDDGAIRVGACLRRNQSRSYGKTILPLSGCLVIGNRGGNWQVVAPDGTYYNVSPYALDSGLWELESVGMISTPMPTIDPAGLHVGQQVETANGTGIIERILAGVDGVTRVVVKGFDRSLRLLAVGFK
jgi:hypothetical protein